MSQNIYDNEIFFTEYMKLRNEKSYNDLLEQPAISKLLPNVKGKTILDIGCGYGHNSLLFAQNGAKKVIGIDLSQKMLEVAKKESCHPCIEYRQMDMSEILALTQKFDMVYSSLAFHYAENFQKLIKDVYDLLNKGGHLIYSQEHPIVTATMNCKGHYNLDENGNLVSYTFSDYAKSGQRVGPWFVDGVINYHRSMGEIVSTLAHTGFMITDMIEPTPESWALEEKPDLMKEFIKPTFLIIKAKKPEFGCDC
ncbi:class I SAM-dependent methyltransferase [Clostridium sp. MSJ-4]|uniref:Class I SAM-dependent methyltransferase n=1 Tax=Clostridium simiarum TaxID=2841506 RepID=A0ABS6F527_9CLOT|nr:class I SAM-dependent methyltransferase [Clostridium simiarum]MBU5592703.1 class I SAM-dependent methyltransferase [Clostridium simiarum]